MEPEAAFSAPEKKSNSINIKQPQLSGNTKDTALFPHHNLDIPQTVNKSRGLSQFDQLELLSSITVFFFLFPFCFLVCTSSKTWLSVQQHHLHERRGLWDGAYGYEDERKKEHILSQCVAHIKKSRATVPFHFSGEHWRYRRNLRYRVAEKMSEWTASYFQVVSFTWQPFLFSFSPNSNSKSTIFEGHVVHSLCYPITASQGWSQSQRAPAKEIGRARVGANISFSSSSGCLFIQL